MHNVLIIGYGVVGRNLEKEIESLSPDILTNIIQISIEFPNIHWKKDMILPLFV